MTYEDHLADLRNKYGRISFYFQMKERADNGCLHSTLLLEEAEKDIVEINDRFEELLKTDPGPEAKVEEAAGS